MNKMNEKYDMTRDTRGFTIAFVNNCVVRYVAKFLSNKLLQNMRLNECTTWMIPMEELCVVGVQLNWSQYLLKEPLAYVEEEQEKGSTFHDSWLLILISFVAWEEPENYHGVYVPVLC